MFHRVVMGVPCFGRCGVSPYTCGIASVGMCVGTNRVMASGLHMIVMSCGGEWGGLVVSVVDNVLPPRIYDSIDMVATHALNHGTYVPPVSFI